MIETNDLVGRLREPDSHDPACPFRDRCYCDSAASHDNVMDDLKLDAADLIQSLSDRIAVLRSDCKFLLSCIDQSNEAGAPVDESDPEDIATIDQIRAALKEGQ